MVTSTGFDYCILGGGIAGLSLADALQDRDHSVCVIEKSEIASGASGTPLGMINPATGRRGTKTWRARQCYEAVCANLRKVSSFSDTVFFRQNGVLRPALTGKIARKMREQYEKTVWPSGWCRWLSAQQVQERHPGITCVNGGLWIPVGVTVDVARYLNALAGWLESEGVEIVTGSEPEPVRDKEGIWTVRMRERTLSSRNLIFATGYDTFNHRWWEDLPLHAIKGQIAVFKPQEALTFSHSISSLGYIAHLNNGEFAQGSTYEHDFDSTEPDEFGEEYLRNRMKRTLPQLEKTCSLVRQWAGVRVTTQNRKPALGRHPEQENLYIYTALGSKGLMYGKYLAEHFAEHLTTGKPLLKAVDVGRFY